MNQCLEKSACDDLSSSLQTHLFADREQEPVAAADAGKEGAWDGSKAVVAQKGRVLLLEHDASLNEMIRDCLVENGYSVVAVQAAGDGICEVLSGDFKMVFCDFMMPGLPGDMFYRAVEKIRPTLCRGFTFITDPENDQRTNDFIKSVHGFAIRKPFAQATLLDSIAMAEVRHGYQSVFEGIPTFIVDSSAIPLTDDPQADRNLRPEAAPSAPSIPRAPARADEPPPRAFGAARWLMTLGLAFPFCLAVVCGFQYMDARGDAALAAVERLELEHESRMLAPRLQTALDRRPELERSLGLHERMNAGRAQPRWTPALRAIVKAAWQPIELLEIHAREVPEDPGACKVRVHGQAVGAQPRRAADRFRLAVEENLRKEASGRPISARFEQLEDAAEASPGQPRATFIIVATIDPMKPAVAPNEEEL